MLTANILCLNNSANKIKNNKFFHFSFISPSPLLYLPNYRLQKKKIIELKIIDNLLYYLLYFIYTVNFIVK